ncbi:dimethylargininase [Polymorphospora rubra]|uniref:Amidinotransferase n=1 Tax=Polymorphospora rubra TaxID=338584 RepID=A0A810N4R1_9ACTN|nr:dimethylargininase [Polymorphospora rubra]BCJ68721.1 amidinotransferase [Polymorphospora rubra]
MSLTAVTPTTAPAARTATRREYLMCPPTHFDVVYAINPWMDPAVPVDRDLARRQWTELRDTYLRLGHTVHLAEPVPGLVDMVFAANCALVVDSQVYGARFREPVREPEAPAYRAWFAAAGFGEVFLPGYANEGEGDFAVVADLILAGSGFRTDPAAHGEAQEFLGRPVVSLRLTDPRFYHLDTALFVLDDDNVAYYPPAFSTGSRRTLARLFPDAILATEADALVLGLNSVSDGENVVVARAATDLVAQLAARGYRPVPVDLSELAKAGGGAKCCTQEIRR